MRLWTLHPRFLDPKGLVAAWREALLAQKVLAGATRGYRNHPQLKRFLTQPDPLATIAAYLTGLAEEAQIRDYNFDTGKISTQRFAGQITETSDQILYEWSHLQAKLQTRAPHLISQLPSGIIPDPHPLFLIVPGEVRDWERT